MLTLVLAVVVAIVAIVVAFAFEPSFPNEDIQQHPTSTVRANHPFSR